MEPHLTGVRCPPHYVALGPPSAQSARVSPAFLRFVLPQRYSKSLYGALEPLSFGYSVCIELLPFFENFSYIHFLAEFFFCKFQLLLFVSAYCHLKKLWFFLADASKLWLGAAKQPDEIKICNFFSFFLRGSK